MRNFRHDFFFRVHWRRDHMQITFLINIRMHVCLTFAVMRHKCIDNYPSCLLSFSYVTPSILERCGHVIST